MRTYKLVEQSQGGFPVTCKRIAYFPVENDDGTTSFKRLQFLLLQMQVEDDKGYRLTVRLNASEGMAHPKFTVQHPSCMDHPKVVMREGKRKVTVRDTLAKKVVVPGEVERYDYKEDFIKRMTKMVGEELCNQMLEEFTRRAVGFCE